MASSTCRPLVAQVTLRVVALITLATVVQPRVGSAAVDLNGDWYSTADPFSPAALVHVTQTGSTLQVGPAGMGTIDSATGAFMLTFQLLGSPQQGECGAQFQGQADPAGNTFFGTGSIIFTPPDCHSIFCACSGSTPAELRGSRSPCGNGVVDAGEECDDGNLGRAGDCCALGCTLRPDGASCSDGLFCNGQETTCQGGVCQLGTPPCLFQCDESTDTCVGGCPTAPLSCRMAQRSRLVVKNENGAGKALSWKWTQGESTSQAEFADPTSGTDYALCVFSGLPPTLIGQAGVPADGTKWSIAGSTGFKYKDAAGTAAGITKISLKGSTVNKSKVQVTGKGSALLDLPLPVTAPVTVQLVNQTTQLCWGASYPTSQLLKNETDQLKARNP